MKARADVFSLFCMHPGTCLCLQMWLPALRCGGPGDGRGDCAAIAPSPAAPQGSGSQGWAVSHWFLLQDSAVPERRCLCFGDLVASLSLGAPGSGWVLRLHRCRKCLSPNWLRMEGLFLRLEGRRCWGPRSGFGSPRAPILPCLRPPAALRREQEGCWA